MKTRRLKYMSKKKSAAYSKRLQAGSNQRSLGKTHLRLLCQKIERSR